MQLLDKLLGRGSERKPAPGADAAGKDPRRAAVGGMGYEEGSRALSPRKVDAAEFKKQVKAAVARGLDAGSFAELRGMYQGLGNLQKYAVSSWMAGEQPALDQALRAGDFGIYESLRE